MEDIAKSITESTKESTMKDGNSISDNKSTLSTIPRLNDTLFSGDPAVCLSNALHLACQHFLA